MGFLLSDWDRVVLFIEVGSIRRGLDVGEFELCFVSIEREMFSR